jgi:putative hemolysin
MLLQFMQEPSVIFFSFLGLVLLLLGSAAISGSEVAFFSLGPQDFHDLQNENTVSSKRILFLRDHPRTLLASMLIGNNFINIAIVIVSDFLIKSLISETTFISWGNSIYNLPIFAFLEAQKWTNILEFLITVVVVTFILVLFGEITPKLYANHNNLKLTRTLSGMLIVLHSALKPFSRILVKSSHIIEGRINRHGALDFGASKEEIDRAIDLTVLHEKDAEKEKTILKSIIKFGEVAVKQIMKARVDIVCLEHDSDFKEVMQVVRESGYSRIPIYTDDLDHLKGILYVKDLLGHFQENADFHWQELIRTNMLYVPEAKRINEVLNTFRQQKMHMAIVVDEYGGTAGLVTLEDIMEEVIGDIRDEFDDETDISYEQIDEFTYLFDGKTMINDMCKILRIEKSIFDTIRGDADSIAGLFLEMIGQIPRKNAEIKYNLFIFKVVSVNKRRIEKIQVTISKT